MANWSIAVPYYAWPVFTESTGYTRWPGAPVVGSLGASYATDFGDYATGTSDLTDGAVCGVFDSGAQSLGSFGGHDPSTDIAVIAWNGFGWQVVVVVGGLSDPAAAVNSLNVAPTVPAGYSPMPSQPQPTGQQPPNPGPPADNVFTW